jgi:hypothetical protein
MPSSNYGLIRAAMEKRWRIVCEYKGFMREICCHTLGLGKAGEQKVLGFQFGGGSSKGLPPSGEWRCLSVDEMQNVRAQSGEWHTRDIHDRPQFCVKQVDYEVMD